jgi:hypothetical protein
MKKEDLSTVYGCEATFSGAKEWYSYNFGEAKFEETGLECDRYFHQFENDQQAIDHLKMIIDNEKNLAKARVIKEIFYVFVNEYGELLTENGVAVTELEAFTLYEH